MREPKAARPRLPEPEPAPRTAPVTTLYPPAPAVAAPAEEALSRGARLSSRQLDALLNGDAAGDSGAEAPGETVALKPEPPAAEAPERRPEPPKPTPLLREASSPEPVAAAEPGGMRDAAAEEEAAGEPPPDGDAAEAAKPRPPLLRRHGTAVLAAGAVAVTLLVSVGLLAATRGLVMAAFPGAAGFYSAVGLSPADGFAEGLEIRGVSSVRSWSDGEQVLTIAGDLANVAEQPRSLPMVRVVLVDGSDAEVQEVVVLPPGETLPVGESIRFEARISNPADTAERIKVSLAPRPEPS